MKGGTLQIAWHGSDPVLTLDFHSTSGLLATGGADHDIKLWSLHSDETKSLPSATFVSSLSYHTAAVNVLRFSPSGIPLQVLEDHLHYVQGVAWDPAGQFIASISGDRTCRIYSNRPQTSKVKMQEKTLFSCQNVVVKEEAHKQDGDASAGKGMSKYHLFHDETLPSFFRRLAWSPDGSFLLVPSGIHKFSAGSASSNTTYILSRRDLSRPALQLPGASKPVIAVRFCPLLFTLRTSPGQKHEHDATCSDVFKLPYRLVFAVASLNSLFIYDTQSACPLAIFAGLHYAAITDIAWSWDAKFLGVSSQDGFCTLIAFDDGELGSPMALNDVPSHIANYLPQTWLARKTIIEKATEKAPCSLNEKNSTMQAESSTKTQAEDTSGLFISERQEMPLKQCEGTALPPLPYVSQGLETKQPDNLNVPEKASDPSSQVSTRPLKLRRIIPTAILADTGNLLESSPKSKLVVTDTEGILSNTKI
eukprot:c19416_g1_i1 orf=651-2081(-)